MLAGIVYDTDRLNGDPASAGGRGAARRRSARPVPASGRPSRGSSSRSRHRSPATPTTPPVEWEGGELEAFVDPERLRLVLEAFVESLVWWTSEGPVRRRRRACGTGGSRSRPPRRGTELTQEDAERLFRPRAPGTGSREQDRPVRGARRRRRRRAGPCRSASSTATLALRARRPGPADADAQARLTRAPRKAAC